MQKHLLPLAALTLALSLNSCTPQSQGHDSGVIRSSSSLTQQGVKQFAAMKRKKRISHNSAYNAQVRRVAARLKPAINLPGAQWEFVVFEDATPNAFALPGGKVGIHTGLFPITKTDAGLAAVLGHEISHVTRNHAGARRKRAVGVALGAAVLDQVARNRGVSDAGRVKLGTGYGALATVGAVLPHSRRNELEADRIGSLYMAKAGYNPTEAISMWQRFSAYKQKKGRGASPEFLRTHPLDNSRINALRAYLPTAMRAYRPR